MRFAAGTRLGPYEIIAALGVGGMGEVYRARDRKLDRDVALKVLPAHLSESPEALARFEREAKAVAVLSHPNILAIHDFGTHEGTAYAVMELLEGDSLRQRLGGGALPVRKAVDYAAQVAHGLAAAHEKGIVHRDLKPENVFVTTDGRVKILDFGLASQGPETGIGAEDQQSETVSRLTQPGTVMGTVGYMSPEQVRGAPADHRSDVFSLGSVLYEMLTGRRAFQRGTAAETLTAILREDPPDLAASAPDVPPGVARIVQHSLEKSPAERFQSARDLAFDLQSISGVTRELSPVARSASPKRLPWVLAVAVGIALGAVAGYLAAGRWPRPDQPTFRQLTFRRGHVTSAFFTPDGHTVVYGAMWEGEPIQVFSTRIGSPESTPLNLPPADVLSVSPSGELALSLGRRFTEWFMTGGRLARAPIGGGAPRELLEEVLEASWAPPGDRLLIVRQVEGKCRLELGVGNVLYETAGWLSHARLSPQGDAVAFLEHPFHGADNGTLAVIPASDKGERNALTREWSSVQGLAWHPSGREIWFTAAEAGWHSALYAITPEGGERLVLRMPGRLGLHDIDRQGRVLLTSENLRVGTFFGSLNSPEERELSWLEASFSFSLSADGKRVLISEQGEGAGERYGIYLRGVDGSPAVRLGDGFMSFLSPDGRWALSMSQDARPRVTLFPTGPGEPRTLAAENLNYQSLGWFPDGRRIAFAAFEGNRGARLYAQDLLGGAAKPFTEEGLGVRATYLPISPDGRWAAALGSGQQAFLCRTDGGETVALSELEPGDVPMRFSVDGSALFCARVGMDSADFVRLDLGTRKRSVWKSLRPREPTGIFTLAPSDVTPDGRHYIYIYGRLLSDLFLVEGLR